MHNGSGYDFKLVFKEIATPRLITTNNSEGDSDVDDDNEPLPKKPRLGTFYLKIHILVVSQEKNWKLDQSLFFLNYSRYC